MLSLWTRANGKIITGDAINYFLPASTNKVLTSGSALLSLGPDYTIKTDVTTFTHKKSASSGNGIVDVLIITGK